MADRFMRRGITQFWFIPTMAAPATPDISTDLAAGEELSGHVSEVAGFTFTNTFIDTPDFGSAFISKIPGSDESEDSSLTIYEYEDPLGVDNPLRTLLAKGTTGFLLIAPYGGSGLAGILAAGDFVDVWPIQIASTPRNMTAANEPSTWRAEIAITGAPSIDVAMAA